MQKLLFSDMLGRQKSTPETTPILPSASKETYLKSHDSPLLGGLLEL